MSSACILEFSGVSASQYHEVNGYLGIDMVAAEGDLPAGMVSHTGARGDQDTFVVFEVWESRAAQQAFMDSRLGAALAKAGVPEPSRFEWFEVEGHWRRQ
jgi:heme-degrading monooxygenase HmoA